MEKYKTVRVEIGNYNRLIDMKNHLSKAIKKECPGLRISLQGMVNKFLSDELNRIEALHAPKESNITIHDRLPAGTKGGN